MNVLFIGQYRGAEFDGWSSASREYLEALLLTSHNISCKPIYMAPQRYDKLSEKILEAEKRKFDSHPDVIIQNVLPDYLEWHQGYNIGIFYTETSNLGKTGWVDKINLMDEIWVNSPAESDSLTMSGVTCKIRVIPIPTNTELLSQYIDVEPQFNIEELKNKFAFYFIGEHNDRKNVMGLVKAFHREFSPSEPVVLVLKTNSQQIKEEINNWKKSSRCRSVYIPELLVNSNLTDKEMASLHQMCDCFVTTSRGESLGRPIVDALYFNRPVICPQGIFSASLFKHNVITVTSHTVPVDTIHPPIPTIYTYNETWEEVDIIELQKEMRHIYEAGGLVCNTRDFVVDTFSRKVISKEIESCLSSVILSEKQ